MPKTKENRREPPPPPPGAPGKLQLLKAGFGLFQPDIWVVDTEGEPRVWKSWCRRPWVERKLIDARLCRREGRVLKKLRDVESVPRFLSHPNRFILEMTKLDAEPVPEVKGGEALSPEYFDRLWGILEAMHTRGINHGDLRRKNLLRAPGDPSTPRMVDFTQCLLFRPPVRGLRGVVLRQAIRVDRVTFLKLKSWFLGEEHLSSEEKRQMKEIPWHLYLGRFLRKKLYRPVRRKLRGKS